MLRTLTTSVMDPVTLALITTLRGVTGMAGIVVHRLVRCLCLTAPLRCSAWIPKLKTTMKTWRSVELQSSAGLVTATVMLMGITTALIVAGTGVIVVILLVKKAICTTAPQTSIVWTPMQERTQIILLLPLLHLLRFLRRMSLTEPQLHLLPLQDRAALPPIQAHHRLVPLLLLPRPGPPPRPFQP